MQYHAWHAPPSPGRWTAHRDRAALVLYASLLRAMLLSPVLLTAFNSQHFDNSSVRRRAFTCEGLEGFYGGRGQNKAMADMRRLFEQVRWPNVPMWLPSATAVWGNSSQIKMLVNTNTGRQYLWVTMAMNIVTTIDSSMYLCSQFKFSFDVVRPYLKC